jgi:poly(3-hydroxybutyrate) depolymerase
MRRRSACALVIGCGLAAALLDCTTDAPQASRSPRSSADAGGTSTDPPGGPTSTSGGPGPTGDAGPQPTGDAAGGGGSSPSNGSPKPNCKYSAHKTGLNAFQQAGGLAFHVYAPTTYDPNVGHTVVVIMHGQDSNGVPELTALWQPIADAEQLVLVAAQGSRPSTTGDPSVGNWAVDDLNHVLDLMTDIDDCYDVFTKKHLLWGFSEGGFYGYLLGLGAAERFSGLAMGGANTSFARENGYDPSSASWKIPVSDVHGTQDPNPISVTLQDQADFQAAGHVFTLHQFDGGHSITAQQVRTQYDDLKGSVAP